MTRFFLRPTLWACTDQLDYFRQQMALPAMPEHALDNTATRTEPTSSTISREFVYASDRRSNFLEITSNKLMSCIHNFVVTVLRCIQLTISFGHD